MEIVSRIGRGSNESIFDVKQRSGWVGAIMFALSSPAILTSSAQAQAQAAGSPAVPGVPTREELEALRQTPSAQTTQLQIEGDVERSPCALADPAYADITVNITGVTINNLKGASESEMEPAWKPFAGTPQPVSVICEIRDAAATILRNKGYLAAVQVPAQRIEGGEVRLEALYARITTIRARGQTRGAERKLEEYLSQLTEDEIFDRDTAERYLLLARDLPGYNVQLTLKPAGTAAGDMVAEVTVVRQPYTLELSAQNYASRATGPWGAELRAQAFGLTGLGDATSVAIYSTAEVEEQTILLLGHQFRPGSEGLVIDGQFTYAWTQPDLGGLTDDLQAKTLFATAGAHYPVIRSQDTNLWLSAGFDFIDQDVELITLVNRDHLRVAWARAQFDAVDLRSRRPGWRVSGTLELRQGLDIFGASQGCGGVCGVGEVPLSRPDGDPTATLVRASGEAEVALGEDVAVALLPRAQYAFNPLLGFEEFTVGNYTVGRGYEPGILLGDDAVGLSVELRGPRLQPFKDFEGRVQPYAFADAAWVWNENDGIGSQRVTSIGAGLRGEMDNRVYLDATLAIPLERAPFQTDRGDVRFLLTLTARLLPWRTN
jgi:hemolysin activation/secretion protein